jgi:hypothetical protein
MAQAYQSYLPKRQYTLPRFAPILLLSITGSEIQLRQLFLIQAESMRQWSGQQ